MQACPNKPARCEENLAEGTVSLISRMTLPPWKESRSLSLGVSVFFVPECNILETIQNMKYERMDKKCYRVCKRKSIISAFKEAKQIMCLFLLDGSTNLKEVMCC